MYRIVCKRVLLLLEWKEAVGRPVRAAAAGVSGRQVPESPAMDQDRRSLYGARRLEGSR